MRSAWTASSSRPIASRPSSTASDAARQSAHPSANDRAAAPGPAARRSSASTSRSIPSRACRSAVGAASGRRRRRSGTPGGRLRCSCVKAALPIADTETGSGAICGEPTFHRFRSRSGTVGGCFLRWRYLVVVSFGGGCLGKKVSMTFGRRLAGRCGLRAAAGRLGACSDDEPEPEVRALRVAHRPPRPPRPEPAAWEEKSEDGAVAFAEHWVDVFNEAQRSGETSTTCVRSAPTRASAATDFAGQLEDLYGDGGVIESEGWTIVQPVPAGERARRTRRSSRCGSTEPAQVVHRADGKDRALRRRQGHLLGSARLADEQVADERVGVARMIRCAVALSYRCCRRSCLRSRPSRCSPDDVDAEAGGDFFDATAYVTTNPSDVVNATEASARSGVTYSYVPGLHPWRGHRRASSSTGAATRWRAGRRRRSRLQRGGAPARRVDRVAGARCASNPARSRPSPQQVTQAAVLPRLPADPAAGVRGGDPAAGWGDAGQPGHDLLDPGGRVHCARSGCWATGWTSTSRRRSSGG